MGETIQNYFEKTKQYPNYYSNEDFSTICDGIKKGIDIKEGIYVRKVSQKIYRGQEFL